MKADAGTGAPCASASSSPATSISSGPRSASRRSRCSSAPACDGRVPRRADLLRPAAAHAPAAATTRARWRCAARASSTATTRSSRRRAAAPRCCACTIPRCSAADPRRTRSPRAATSCASSCTACCARRRRAHAFPHRVGLHAGCHALRELRLGTPSEGGARRRGSRARAARRRCAGIELVPLARARRVLRLRRRLLRSRSRRSPAAWGSTASTITRAARAEVLTSSDLSCLLHLGGAGAPPRQRRCACCTSRRSSRARSRREPRRARRRASCATPPRARWHDGVALVVREKRDRAAAAVAGLGGAARARPRRSSATRSRSCPATSSASRRARARAARTCTGRATPPSTTRSCSGCCASAGATRVVKSKSMLTEECGLNPYLEARGIEVVDTDLGERIVQLRHEPPSHIVMPAIHLRRAGDRRALPRASSAAPAGLDDPTQLTEVARARPARALPRRAGRASPASTSRSPRPAASSSAPTRATPISAPRCRRSTSPAWASRS